MFFKSQLIFAAIITLLVASTFCLYNPGILVTIPFPISPPQIDLNLPISIQPIIIQSLELSSISVKEINYSWNFTENEAIVKISDAHVIFSWIYKNDHGQGTFTETSYELQLSFETVKNADERLGIEIGKTKSKLGHSSVHLGGDVKESVVIEITKLILNHAAITFRKSIEKAIKNAIVSFSSILGSDVKLFCNSQSLQQFEQAHPLLQKQRCLFLNSTLVAPPIISNKDLLIQINGAVYETGSKSGYLNPENALVRTDAKIIEAQIHSKMLEQIGQKIFKLIDSTIDFRLDQVNDVVDINSLTVSPVFPKMAQIKPSPVELSIQFREDVQVSLNASSQSISFRGSAVIDTYVLQEGKRGEKYMQQWNATASAEIGVVYGSKSFSLRVNHIEVEKLDFVQSDIDQGFVNPERFEEVLPTLCYYLQGGINGGLNTRLTTLEFGGILAVLKGEINEHLLRIDLNLQKSLSEGIKVMMD